MQAHACVLTSSLYYDTNINIWDKGLKLGICFASGFLTWSIIFPTPTKVLEFVRTKFLRVGQGL